MRGRRTAIAGLHCIEPFSPLPPVSLPGMRLASGNAVVRYKIALPGPTTISLTSDSSQVLPSTSSLSLGNLGISRVEAVMDFTETGVALASHATTSRCCVCFRQAVGIISQGLAFSLVVDTIEILFPRGSDTDLKSRTIKVSGSVLKR